MPALCEIRKPGGGSDRMLRQARLEGLDSDDDLLRSRTCGFACAEGCGRPAQGHYRLRTSIESTSARVA